MTRTKVLALATVLLLLGLVELLVGLARAELLTLALGDLASVLVGWGTFVELPGALSWTLRHARHVADLKVYGVPGALQLGQLHLGLGIASWLAGWGLLAVTLRNEQADPVRLRAVFRSLLDSASWLLSRVSFGLFRYRPAPPEFPPNGLHPRLANYVDFHWGTLLAYGFGFLISELVFIRLYLAVVGKGTVQGGEVVGGLSPVVSFLVSFGVAMLIAFAGGFIGAANSKRLSTPEATLALIYFGLPVPISMTEV